MFRDAMADVRDDVAGRTGQTRTSLLAVYDCTVAPPTFDFFNFLVLAEAHRLKAELDDIHLAIVPHASGGFFTGLPTDAIENAWRLHNMLIPGAALLRSCTQITVCADRAYGDGLVSKADHIFPPRYSINGPIGIYLASELSTAWACGTAIPSLAAPEPARKYVSQYIDARAKGRRVVTLTVRQASYASYRNSDLGACRDFALALDPDRYFVVVLPDMEQVFQLPAPELAGLTVFGEATANLMVRAALYELAFLNLMRASGPGHMALLLHRAPTILFVQPTEDAPIDNSMSAFHGGGALTRGDQYPYLQPHQKLSWRAETAENLMDELRQFEAYKDGRIASETFKPPTPQTPRSIADLLARSDQPAQAQDIYEHLLAQNGFDAEIALAIVRLRNERGMHGAALDLIGELKARGVTQTEIGEQEGDALAGLSRHDEAILAYSTALALSDLTPARRARIAIKNGLLLARRGRAEDAEQGALAALSGGPPDRLLLQFLGELWSGRGQPDRAQPYIEREIALLRNGNPDDAEAIRLGTLFVLTRQFEAAHRHLSGVIQRAPMNWAAHEALADAMLGLGNVESAIAHLDAAIRHCWDREPTPRFKLARIRTALEDLGTAERDIRRCIELAPAHAPAYQLLSHILMRQNRSADALQALLRARELEVHK